MKTVTEQERLLAATVEHLEAHGIGDLSLRQLAAAIGTSHRMLIYHFGSKDGLLRAVVQAVEREQLDALRALDRDTNLSEADLMRNMWKRFSAPAMWPKIRLFYEVYGNALGARTSTFLDEVVESWVEPLAAELKRTRGMTAGDARAEARLRVAVERGLLLDLVTTGDRASVNRAHERFIAMCEAQ
jgi:AcrR family transcriptional regulator